MKVGDGDTANSAAAKDEMGTEFQCRLPSVSSTSSEAAKPKIRLLCHDLTPLLRLDSAWTVAGAMILKKTGSDTPDCIVIDLGQRVARRFKLAD